MPVMKKKSDLYQNDDVTEQRRLIFNQTSKYVLFW